MTVKSVRFKILDHLKTLSHFALRYALVVRCEEHFLGDAEQALSGGGYLRTFGLNWDRSRLLFL